ncbi:hypothetical protein DYB36_010029 [Aphanomyces astaci]|uniref:Membrane-associated protein n=1 Tax=Aphanomyces astaci TaxID=112090 RepID=A0A397B3Z6_APHAT|nr:hypothetical protein DYB36_010029 [Aphanomyces astaci]
MQRLWGLTLWLMASDAVVDNAIYMPWRISTTATPSTSPPPPSNSYDVPTLTFPRCEFARPEDITCHYRIRVVLATTLDATEVSMADAWLARLQSRTEGEVYQVGSQHCAISWETDEVYIPTMPTDHPCRYRIPVCTVFEATEISTNATSSNVTGSEDALLLEDRFRTIKSPSLSQHGEPCDVDAMVAFFGQAYDYHHLVQYGKARGIPTAQFFFHHAEAHQLSESINAWTSKDSLFDVDLLGKFNLHYATESRYQCASVLANGMPVLYVDDGGIRRCSCQCRHGFELTSSGPSSLVCEEIPTMATDECVFNHRYYAYNIDTTFDHDNWNQCHISQGHAIRHMPYPTHNRTDGKLLHVQVTSQSNNTLVFDQPNVPWLPTGQHRVDVLAPLVLRSPGVYLLQVDWNNLPIETNDYSVQPAIKGNGVACDACLAITDRFRPVSNVMCLADAAALHELPPTLSSNVAIPTAEYSVRNLLKTDAFVAGHYAYGTDVRNDVCGSSEGGRCDVLKHTRRDFFDLAPIDQPFADGRTCLTDPVNASTLRRLQASPFGSDLERIQLDIPVPPGQCTRCCTWETTLKEWWVNYQCPPHSPSAEPQCSGSGDSCVSSQCLVGFGPTFFQARAAIHPTVQAETEAMMSTVFPDVEYGPSSEVHVLLECTAFGQRNPSQKCSHGVPLSALLTWTSGLNDVSVVRTKSDQSFVSWRYRLITLHNSSTSVAMTSTGNSNSPSSNNEGNELPWASVDTDSFVRFDAARSVVEMEAWSQCGRVAAFQFHVMLHLTQATSTADAFDQMWYQTSTRGVSSQGLVLPEVLSPFPESPFAELTFDFAPAMGVESTSSSWTHQKQPFPHVPMWVSTGVQCTVQLGAQSPALVVTSSKVNVSIVQRMAIALPRYGDSFVQVECNFTYKHVYFSNRTLDVTMLRKRFSILPQVNTVTFDQPEGDLHRVCRGRLVQLSESGNATEVVDTHFTTCRAPTVCAPLFSLPGVSQDISQCVLEWDNVMLLQRWEQTPLWFAMPLGLLGLSGVLSVVVVVAAAWRKARRAVGAPGFDDDMYYYYALDI